jgi:4-amino-4-deoxy-L-arabinose transferase-like glycosyltransferase
MPDLKTHKRFLQDFFFLFFLSSFFFLFDLGRGSLASWDEAIYATVAKEIIGSGDWFRLTLGGDAWSDKPPLCIWMTAFFYKLFGVGEFSARLFSALCGIGTVIVTYLFGSKLFGRWVGLWGALVLVSSSHYIHFARFAMMDAPFTFFLTLSLYLFWLGRERNRYLIFSGIAIGLAVMAKGFAAFFIFPIVWIYCLWAGEQEVLGRSSYWIGLMIAALIALPWNIYEMLSHQKLFMTDVVTRHLLARTFTALDGHGGNFYFYIRTVINKYHPWILVGVVSAPFFLWKAIRHRQREFILPSVWMFFILAVVTLIRTKLHWYILPVYPALSLSVGYFLAKTLKERAQYFVYFLFIIIMIVHIPESHIFDHDYSRLVKGIAPLVKKQLPSDQTLYLYNYHESPAVLFYAQRRSAYLDDKAAFVNQARHEKNFSCLVRQKEMADLADVFPSLGLSVKESFSDIHLVQK